ncbi:MAG: hypothetical protein JRG81_17320 [Deltaproteobacteria bacterium]|nr:hypothetical protein [Deltaproteobacteria bacterium]
MKKQMLLLVLVLLSVFLVFGSSLAWQGRMAGMGDPYGLTPDESDFLIHPSLIVGGKVLIFTVTSTSPIRVSVSGISILMIWAILANHLILQVINMITGLC